ncbi:hypothetical protein [Micrococcus sp.]|uniref:hypothetical protein n=1 Tax=Micrococcus sp. TaxID=1271 RepID=UPI002A911001|nr:hypothetical protein [Micrococcus sp.]MDY6054345.1 hypothetical protein [Micrococcus sp.]
MIDLLRAAAARVPFTTHLLRADLPDPGDPAAYPYVVLWADLGVPFSGDGRDSGSLGDRAAGLHLTIRATYVGLSPAAVAIVASKTRAALDRQALASEGWHCDRLRVFPVLGIDSDESVQLQHGHPYYAVDEYRVIATKVDPA